ncbi:MAG: putative DNA base hypermodification protein [Alphaproteobacteria bacterium]|nr:putative DNA base hypermodification protein [Alphaproteobacteria bacterium]MCL2758469.1 putative DNA base hypermodification protein [Alphaproteobacteria bacterium]
MQNLIEFYEFIYDRQKIWHDRFVLKQSAPWATDPIFSSFKFCNVYRELDSGTTAISKHLIGTDITPENKLLNIIAYRIFNKRDTFERLFDGLLDIKTFDVKKLEKRFDKIEGPIFSDAYLISSHPFNKEYRPKDKHVQVLLMLDALIPKLPQILEELKHGDGATGLGIIEKYVAMAGPFLSGQILLDCTYSRNSKGRPDIVLYTSNDFLIVGPGAHWGLEILFGKKLNKIEANEKCRFLHASQKEYFALLKKQKRKDWFGVKWDNPDYSGSDYVSLHDIQGCLCEFRKYTRLKSGEKAKKRYFKIS